MVNPFHELFPDFMLKTRKAHKFWYKRFRAIVKSIHEYHFENSSEAYFGWAQLDKTLKKQLTSRKTLN